MTISLLTHVNADLVGAGGTTGAIDTTGATLLIFAAGSSKPAGSVFSDSKGNAWTTLANWGGNAGSYAQIAYCLSPTVGTGHTFTIGTSNYPGVVVAAFSGVTGARDLSLGASGVQPGSGTPAQNNELIVTALCFTGSGLAVNQGFTIVDVAPNTTSNGCGLAYLAQGAAAALNPTWTGTSLGAQNAAMASWETVSAASNNAMLALL